MRLFSVVLALYLWLGALFPGMDFSQLSSVSTLYQHFNEHNLQLVQTKQVPLSLMDFLWLHMSDIDSHDHEEGTRHADLPFQQFNLDLQFLCLTLPTLLLKNRQSHLHRTPIFIPQFNPEEWETTVFHPPV